MILHKFSSSPFETNTLAQSIQRIQTNDKIILVQDAVYTYSNKELAEALSTFSPIYCLEDDLVARGVNIDNDVFKAISYADFVELTLTCNQVISW